MSVYETIVCDRCGAEARKDHSNSWAGWHQSAQVRLTDVTRLYSGFPDFGWNGDLCSPCAGAVDAAVRALFDQPTTPSNQEELP